LDSDVIIEVLRERSPNIVREWINVANTGDPLFYSPVSLAEVRHGVRDQERELIERVFSGMSCIALETTLP
jgi:predicted nucleic acid-binding protein